MRRRDFITLLGGGAAVASPFLARAKFGIFPGELQPQSGLMLAARITLAHLSVSSAMNVPKPLGVIGMGSLPRSASRSFLPGSARAALISLLSLSAISTGVFVGAPRP